MKELIDFLIFAVYVNTAIFTLLYAKTMLRKAKLYYHIKNLCSKRFEYPLTLDDMYKDDSFEYEAYLMLLQSNVYFDALVAGHNKNNGIIYTGDCIVECFREPLRGDTIVWPVKEDGEFNELVTCVQHSEKMEDHKFYIQFELMTGKQYRNIPMVEGGSILYLCQLAQQ